MNAALCRTCGALATHTTTGWTPAQPGARCSYGATAHPFEGHPRAGQMITAGLTRVPAGDTLAPA